MDRRVLLQARRADPSFRRSLHSSTAKTLLRCRVICRSHVLVAWCILTALRPLLALILIFAAPFHICATSVPRSTSSAQATTLHCSLSLYELVTWRASQGCRSSLSCCSRRWWTPSTTLSRCPSDVRRTPSASAFSSSSGSRRSSSSGNRQVILVPCYS